MADGISVKFNPQAAVRGLAARQLRMDRAAMWAVRQAGREVRREAARAAPVLKDPTRSSYSTIRSRARRGLAPSAETFKRPVPGLLKASIRPSRNVRYRGRADYSIKVGPRGQRVHLYAGKIEDRAHYMDRGESAGTAAMQVYAVQAFNRVWRG